MSHTRLASFSISNILQFSISMKLTSKNWSSNNAPRPIPTEAGLLYTELLVHVNLPPPSYHIFIKSK